MGTTSGIGADQDFTSDPIAGGHRKLGQCLAGDGDVVGGGVRAGITGPQQHGDRFTGAAGAVVDERTQRVKTESPLVGGVACSFSECAPTRVASDR